MNPFSSENCSFCNLKCATCSKLTEFGKFPKGPNRGWTRINFKLHQNFAWCAFKRGFRVDAIRAGKKKQKNKKVFSWESNQICFQSKSSKFPSVLKRFPISSYVFLYKTSSQTGISLLMANFPSNDFPTLPTFSKHGW